MDFEKPINNKNFKKALKQSSVILKVKLYELEEEGILKSKLNK